VPNLAYSDLGFKKFSRGETPGRPLLRGPLRGEGGGGEGGDVKGPALALAGPVHTLEFIVILLV